jgi:hypothetical protein
MTPLERGEPEAEQSIPPSLDDSQQSRSPKDRVAALEREVMHLRREVGVLRQVVSDLERKLAVGDVEEAFVEYRGALFKRKVAGGFFEEVYCPMCRQPMRSPQNELNFTCRECQTWVNIKGHELPEVMAKVRRFDR